MIPPRTFIAFTVSSALWVMYVAVLEGSSYKKTYYSHCATHADCRYFMYCRINDEHMYQNFCLPAVDCKYPGLTCPDMEECGAYGTLHAGYCMPVEDPAPYLGGGGGDNGTVNSTQASDE